MQQQRRKYNYLKCTQCRKDKQSCTPIDRIWPGQRCVRCVRYNYACSQNFTAKASSKETAKTSQQGRPIWHERDVTNRKDLLTLKGDQDGLLPNDLGGSSKVDSTKGNPSYSINPFKDEHSNAQSTPRCAKLFTNLTNAWTYLEEPSTNKEPLLTILRRLKRDCAIASLRLNGMQRIRSTGLYQLQQVELEKKVADGIPRDEAVKLVTANLFAKFQEVEFDYQDTMSVNDFVKHISGILQAGERWQELIDACGCREILLIDEVITYDDVKISDDQDEGTKRHNNIDSEVDSDVDSEDQVEACLMEEDDIIQHGTDTKFKDLKRILLAPELCLKATCQRLDGVLDMMERCGFGDHSFLRLGGDVKIENGDKHPLSNDLREFLDSEIQRRIEKVFGKPKSISLSPFESPGNQDSSDNGDQSLSEKINGRETAASEKKDSDVAETFSESNIFSGNDNLVDKCTASKQVTSPKNAMFTTENSKSNANTSNNDNTTGAVSNTGFEFGSGMNDFSFEPNIGAFSSDFSNDFWSNVEVDFDFKSLQI